MEKEIKKAEKERLQLTPEEIESKRIMLREEESKKRGFEEKILSTEKDMELGISKKSKEIQILQLKAQTSQLPALETQLAEGLKNVDEDLKLNLNHLKNSNKIIESNIKVLKRQISTKMA